MLEQRTVPGVYIQELNAFPNSVVEVATALPVFIGYTQNASYQGNSLQNKVIKIESLSDYQAFFGYWPTTTYSVAAVTPAVAPAPPAPYDVILNANAQFSVTPVASSLFYMYNSIQLFFQNGGGTAYVLSIGNYANEGANGPNVADFSADIFTILQSVQDPTMILVPDALLFSKSGDYYTLINNCLDHCAKVQSRMTLIDVYAGDQVKDPLAFNALAGQQDANGIGKDPISQMRAGITSMFLNYGAVYYPWVNTNIVSGNQVTFLNIAGGFTGTMVDTDATIAGNV